MGDLNSQNDQLAILVLSCDKNSNLWPPFFSFLRKFWIDCPYKIYLGTNFLKTDEQNVSSINSNKSSNWSDELKIILDQISEKYVMIILEDYFIYKAVNTVWVKNAYSCLQNNNASFMMLACFPYKYKSIWNYEILPEAPGYGEINRASEYLVNLQIGIWNKNILSELLVDGESPWQFELEASKRFANKNYRSLCIQGDRWKNYVHGPIVYLCGALTKSVVMREAIRLCKKENIEFIVKGKRIETIVEEISRRLYIGLPLSMRKGIGFVKATFRRLKTK